MSTKLKTMTPRAVKIIEIFGMPENIFYIMDNGDVSFEAFEYPFNYEKGLVITSDVIFNIDDDQWFITYSQDGDIFEITEEEREDIEGWIVTHCESIIG